MDVRWDLLAQYPDAGQAFAQAFNQGMQQNALAGFAQNPGDPRAQAAASRYEPGAVMQYRQQQQTAQAQHQQELDKQIGLLAKWADTPDKWDQAVTHAVEMGYPQAEQLRGKFSPATRAALMAHGGIPDTAPTQDPSIIREYDIATQRGLIPPGTSFEDYMRARNPALQTPIVEPAGSQPPATLTDEQMKQMMGGQAGSSSPVPFR